MRKKVGISLQWVAGVAGDVDHYIVRSIHDSVDYHPGERLDERTVKGLCEKAHWSVDIKG